MVSMASGYIGFVGVLCIGAALRVPKLPKFQSETFKAKSADEQHRSIRNMRALFILGAIFSFSLLVAIGFIEGYIGAKADSVSMQTGYEAIQSESETIFADLNRVEQSMENVMAPERLVTAEGLAEAHTRLGDWSDAISRFEVAKRNLLARAEALVLQSSLAQSDRDATLAGFRRGVANTQPITNELVRAKRDVIAAAGQKLALLQARMGQVTVKNGELSFSNPVDAQSNTAIDAQLNDAAEREEAAVKKLEQRALADQQKADQVFKK